MRPRSTERSAAARSYSSIIAPTPPFRSVLLIGHPSLFTLAVRQNSQERNPGSDRFPVLLRHDPGHLGDVPQVMNHPRRQQLPQSDPAEVWVRARQIEIRVLELPGTQCFEICRPQPREFIEERFEGAVPIALPMTEAVVGFEARFRTARENDPSARYPVR